MGINLKDLPISRMTPEARANLRAAVGEDWPAEMDGDGAVTKKVKGGVRTVLGYILGSPAQAEAAANVLQLYKDTEALSDRLAANPATASAAAIVRAALPGLKEALGRLGNHG